jgi:ubiquinone biosynthesis protein
MVTLQDKVPPVSGVEARGIIERATGRRISDMFASFDDTAVGAASIGCEHAGLRGGWLAA